MFKKKKGYTLIEVIIVLAILTVIVSITSMNVSKMKNIVYKITLQEYVNEVRSLLSFGKSYCRKNMVNGMIILYDNRIAFVVQEKEHKINKFTSIKSDLRIDSNFSGGSSKINKDGYITSAGTIVVRMGKSYIEINIGVGNDIIGVSEVDIIE